MRWIPIVQGRRLLPSARGAGAGPARWSIWAGTFACVLSLGGCANLGREEAAVVPPEAASAPAAAPAPAPEPQPEPRPDAWQTFLLSLEPPSRAEVPVALTRGANGTVLIRVSGPTLFGKNGLPSASFSSFLVRLAEATSALGDVLIEVDGHTEARGSAARNLTLSRTRAQAVAKKLAAAGIAPARLQSGGQGQAVPVASNKTPSGRAANSRMDIVVSRGAPVPAPARAPLRAPDDARAIRPKR